MKGASYRALPMRWLALALCGLSLSCAKVTPQVSHDRWTRHTSDSVEGAWTSEATMAGGEGGECRITVGAGRVELRCSPGNRTGDYRIMASKRTGDLVVLELEAADGQVVQLEIEGLRDARGVRALRIRDLQRPNAPPLGAYGRPEVWVEEGR